MRLLIDQKIFSLGDKLLIMDEYQNEMFYVEGEFLSFGKKLRVYDLSGFEVAFIRQEVFSFLTRFDVFVEGYQIADIVKEITFFKQKYTINGLDWQVEGDFFGHDYQIIEDNRVIAELHKEWLFMKDFYVLDIYDEDRVIEILAVCLAIDAAIDLQSSQ